MNSNDSLYLYCGMLMNLYLEKKEAGSGWWPQVLSIKCCVIKVITKVCSKQTLSTPIQAFTKLNLIWQEPLLIWLWKKTQINILYHFEMFCTLT